MILCEDGPGGRPALFDGAEGLVVARAADQVAPALVALDAARAAGKWVAGCISYEAGYAMEPRLAPLMPATGATPLLAFGIYDGPQDASPALARAADAAQGVALDPLQPMISVPNTARRWTL